ncbi:phosphate ABC transporter permease PstA [Anaerobranca gottschalkii]|uniref:Phosphate transport system permease protein PstA n=1 Tax=Anaerobranca gottschalkii DSM 13577 TaxID=1120990 RepID=A0A1I0AF45_9FIRM|nr:phosphate ABC transporter permease PstA [Anaerobranca gottschalkii]SES92869.1 phosphate ABC transporter membrane protein 2, PhoT family [Anaerobranca gottschalkii DSM 13577]
MKQRFQNFKVSEFIGYTVLNLFAITSVFVLLFMVYNIVSKGYSAINWTFITQIPRSGMTQGGIMPAIVGTLYVSILTLVIAVPLGVGAAIYLNEFSSQGKLNRIIKLCIRNMAGIPSIVYGLFGLGLFVAGLKLGHSLLASALTLSLMTYPVIVTTAEEALKAVPQSFRDGAMALGATKWQAIRYQVLPAAIPGMATGAILGLGRAAGETAPIILTGAAYFLPILPKSVTDQFMALPYHLFILSTQHSKILEVRHLAYGTALVLLTLVLLLNTTAIGLRIYYRKTKKW